MRRVVFSAFFIVLVAGLFYYVTVSFSPEKAFEKILQTAQNEEVSLVEEIHRNIPDIIRNHGIKEALQVVGVAFSEHEISLNACHSLSHRIGHDAITVYGDDFDGLLEHASDFCARGYWHGAEAQIVLEGGDISERLGRFCIALTKINPGTTCFHGAGHALMNQTLDVQEALGWCNVLQEKNNIDNISDCYEGVFSELTTIAGGTDGETGIPYAGKPPITLEVSPLIYCGRLESKYHVPCARELNGLFLSPDLTSEEFHSYLQACVRDAVNDELVKACLYNTGASFLRTELGERGVATFDPWILTINEDFRRSYIEGVSQEMGNHVLSGLMIDTDSFCESFIDISEQNLCKDRVLKYSSRTY